MTTVMPGSLLVWSSVRSVESLPHRHRDMLHQRQLTLEYLFPGEVFKTCASELDGVVLGEVVRLSRGSVVEVAERFEVFREPVEDSSKRR